MSDSRAFFVVGVGRSGTSLLQSMLAAHSELALPPETGFLRRYAAAGKITKLARQSSHTDIVKLLEADSRLQRIAVSFTEVVSAAANPGPLTDFSVYQSLLSTYAKSVGKSYVGDKDPRMIEHLDILHSAYPDADVIQIIRDPRDVLASKKKADWSRRYSSLRHVFAYRVQLVNGRRAGQKWFGPRYHELIYESLLAKPEKELRALCDKLKINFDMSMLQFSAAAKELVAPDEMNWKQETMGPLLEKNFGKWREALSARDVALVEYSCAAAMKQFAYESSYAWRRLTITDRVRVWLLGAVIAIAEPAYRLYRFIRNYLARRNN